MTQAMNQSNQMRGVTAKDEQYAYYLYKQMSGCVIMLFSKIKMLNRIKELYMCKVKAKKDKVIEAFAMNKGSVAMRFKIDATTFAFLNCHLKAGEGHVNERVDMLSQILEQTLLRKKGFIRDEEH